MSDLLLNYKDISIYSRDLSLFYDGQWLNDVCINFCLAKKAEELQNESVLFMDPSVVSFMTFQVDDEGEMEELAAGQNLSFRKWILIPVNDCTSLGGSSSHWSLLVCHIESGYMAHLDSNHQYNIQSARNIAKKLSLLLKRTLPEIQQLDTPQQKNGYDCGVYSIQYAYYISDVILSSADFLPPAECVMQAIKAMRETLTSAAVTKFRLRSIRDIEKLSKEYMSAKEAKGVV